MSVTGGIYTGEPLIHFDRTRVRNPSRDELKKRAPVIASFTRHYFNQDSVIDELAESVHIAEEAHKDLIFHPPHEGNYVVVSPEGFEEKGSLDGALVFLLGGMRVIPNPIIGGLAVQAYYSNAHEEEGTIKGGDRALLMFGKILKTEYTTGEFQKAALRFGNSLRKANMDENLALYYIFQYTQTKL